MLVVKQGEVAVIKAAVGLPTQDVSGDEFKFGSIVHPGHRGIREEPLRAVVGNYFRDTLQGMAAVQFIENRAAVQTQAQACIAEQS